LTGADEPAIGVQSVTGFASIIFPLRSIALFNRSSKSAPSSTAVTAKRGRSYSIAMAAAFILVNVLSNGLQ
jgi:hypothetical protein